MNEEEKEQHEQDTDSDSFDPEFVEFMKKEAAKWGENMTREEEETMLNDTKK